MKQWRWDGQRWQPETYQVLQSDGRTAYPRTFNAGYVRWTKRNRPRTPGPRVTTYGVQA